MILAQLTTHDNISDDGLELWVSRLITTLGRTMSDMQHYRFDQKCQGVSPVMVSLIQRREDSDSIMRYRQ